ncbi:Imm15 family immunity protein [Pseudomonas purpurea]|uniref:Imm15 family immunity protein n=1 Tax=Pseudomonas purpurea TaxID=3136737 RepID=UPI003263AB46
MRLTDLYNKVISQEPYNDMNVFFSDYESFEEIPLISRYRRLDFLKQEMNEDNIPDFLISFSVFLLNSIKVLSTTTEKNKTFFAITFTNFELLDESGLIIPNIFIYPNSATENFLDEIQNKHSKNTSRELEKVKRHFSRCTMETIFNFYESRFHDPACGEDLVRIFAIQKSMTELNK